MHTPDDVASWMLEQLNLKGQLLQMDAASEIEKLFGREFVSESEYGGSLISKKVLSAFTRLTKDEVVYCKIEKYWRKRLPDDSPGRQQYC